MERVAYTASMGGHRIAHSLAPASDTVRDSELKRSSRSRRNGSKTSCGGPVAFWPTHTVSRTAASVPQRAAGYEAAFSHSSARATPRAAREWTSTAQTVSFDSPSRHPSRTGRSRRA
jgi:hypothetical protein